MADIQVVLQTHREAVEEFLAAARKVPVAQWNQPRAPGKWSPGQVAEHLALAYEMNRRVLNGAFPGTGAPRLLRPLLRRFLLNPVLKRGKFVPGSKTPKVFRPSASPPQQAPLVGRLQIAAKAFEADAGALARDAIEHPIFGQLALTDFVRLQEIHTRHHRNQIGSPT
ncbi:MAG TPA: DinB family protein [Gemmatimonadales bacterium]